MHFRNYPFALPEARPAGLITLLINTIEIPGTAIQDIIPPCKIPDGTRFIMGQPTGPRTDHTIILPTLMIMRLTICQDSQAMPITDT